MTLIFAEKQAEQSIPISLVSKDQFEAWLSHQSDYTKAWLAAARFQPKTAAMQMIPDPQGNLSEVLFCLDGDQSVWPIGSLPFLLPEGQYYFKNDALNEQAYLAFGLGAYQFDRYKKADRKPAQLFVKSKDLLKKIKVMLDAIFLARDLINTPAEDMGPLELAQVAKDLAEECGASFHQIVGEDLLQENYPAIHFVGRASHNAPRLIDIRWGESSHPKLTLVGKGVCFDTGGLDLKPSPYMTLMKKDMGGAAHVLALAKMIMKTKLSVSLRVLIPAVENALSGNAYRPGDVITSRSGKTIEIGNTDAEGRLVLADALTEAISDQPDLIIDFATLTGAARVALGTDLPAVFANCDEVAARLIELGETIHDPIWQLPLFDLYRDLIKSDIADLNNCPSEPYGGAITAALFLQAFVPDSIPWLHFDVMAWNLKTRPAHPKGGEAVAIRALFAYLCERFGA